MVIADMAARNQKAAVRQEGVSAAKQHAGTGSRRECAGRGVPYLGLSDATP